LSCCLPASPELQRAERSWPLVDKPAADRMLADLALAKVLVTPGRTLKADPATIRAKDSFT
jgi:hypothetical protein